MGYLSRYNLQDEYAPQSFSYAPPAQPMPESGGGLSAGSPGMTAATLGAGFLVNYLNRKAQEFENKKQAQMGVDQNYAQGQNAALNSLLGSYRSILT